MISSLLRVFVFTNDKSLWTLAPFAYLFNTYWSELQEVIIQGYKRPDFKLPENFSFYSVDDSNYPPERWSDGVSSFLRAMPDDRFVLLLDDYWLCRTVDHVGIGTLSSYMAEIDPSVIRMDLTADRLYAGGMHDIGAYGHYDIIEAPGSQYQMSLQAAIWDRRKFLEILRPSTNPWDMELHTNIPEHMRVVGTRQWPVRYANALKSGQLNRGGPGNFPEGIDKIQEPHLSHILEMIKETSNERK